MKIYIDNGDHVGQNCRNRIFINLKLATSNQDSCTRNLY